jgi:hypothetical protein
MAVVGAVAGARATTREAAKGAKRFNVEWLGLCHPKDVLTLKDSCPDHG